METILTQLEHAGLLSADALQQVREALGAGKDFDDALHGARGINEAAMLRHLGDYFEIPFIDLEHDSDKYAPSRELLAKFPARILIDHRLMPISTASVATPGVDHAAVAHNGEHATNGNGAIGNGAAANGRLAHDQSVTIVTSRVFDHSGLDQLRLATGIDVVPALAASTEIDRFAKKYLGVGADTLQSMNADDDGIKIIDEQSNEDLDLTEAAQDASIIKFVNQVMAEALESRATDVHVEPYEDELRVRYRVDGVLVEANIPPQVRKYQAAIVSRIKILSHLDIAEKRVPQDGRIRLKVAGREIDLRVSVIPMIHGEAVVLRILDRGDTVLGLEHLGMSQRDQNVWERALDLPHGIILVTGPTGSGKTTSLYAALSRINKPDLKIVTIEDPVEYQLRGINQIQINTKSGLTFAAGLRAILRHDPDVVLIGEIRDRETAEIAVQASLTGHLVFSTLHTNDAPGATTRLVDMGIEPYLVASSLEMVAAQRLVRLICKKCKEPMPPSELEKLRHEFGTELPEVLYHGRGCRDCQGTGYRGRQGVFELMSITDDVRAMILTRSSSRDVRKLAIKEGMRSLREDGWRLIREGRSTAEEVLRMTKNEELSELMA